MPNKRYPEEMIAPEAYQFFQKMDHRMVLVHHLNESKFLTLCVGRPHFTMLDMAIDRINRDQPENGYYLPYFDKWKDLNYVDLWHLLATVFYAKASVLDPDTLEWNFKYRAHQKTCPWYVGPRQSTHLAHEFGILCDNLNAPSWIEAINFIKNNRLNPSLAGHLGAFCDMDEYPKWRHYIREREKFLLLSDPLR